MKDKISFAIALLGVVVALTPFKDTLNQIQLNFGFAAISVLWLLYISLSLLFLSVYLYALDYAKDGFRFLDQIPISKYLQLAGNVLYFTAILSPIIYVVVWASVQLILLIPVPDISLKLVSQYSSTLISVISLVVSIIAAWRKNKVERIAKEEQLDESATNAVSEAKKLVDSRMWSLSIIESYRSLELNLNKKLIDLGYGSRQFQSYRAAEVLAQKGILSKDDLRDIQLIRESRNRAAHTSVDFTEEEAVEILGAVKRILPKLETSANKASSVEKKIIQALIDNGLFPKDRLDVLGARGYTSYEGYDAKGRGPNHNYLIEIKLTKSANSLLYLFHQLKDVAKQQNNRLLFIVRKEIGKLLIDDDNVRVLFYDAETNQFTNRDDVFNWIYADSRAQ